MNDADWSGARFREALVAMARKRVPESDVEDVVQAALTEALVSKSRPEDPESLRKWIWGVARNKVADYHRRSRRETFDVPEVAVDAAAHSERDLLRWATRSLPKGKDAEETLEWLLREGEGEKLEAIAESANVPAPRVRKRVSRLRAHLREHWAKEAAALAALGIILGLAIYFLRKKPVEPIAHDPLPVPTVSPEEQQLRERAKEMRRVALVACDNAEWVTCLNGLNGARELDPEGDRAPEVGAARARAQEEIQKQITPAPSLTQKVAPPLNQKSSTPPPPVYKGKPPAKTAVKPSSDLDLEGLGSKNGSGSKKAWDQRTGP